MPLAIMYLCEAKKATWACELLKMGGDIQW